MRLYLEIFLYSNDYLYFFIEEERFELSHSFKKFDLQSNGINHLTHSSVPKAAFKTLQEIVTIMFKG